MAMIGYCRVSTDQQSLAVQIDALKAAGCEKVFEETASGAQRERPELARMLGYVRAGDVVAVHRLDRLARSLKQLIDTVETLAERGVGFCSLTENLDTRTAGGMLVFHVFGAIGQFERELIRSRTVDALRHARAMGRVGGRPRKLTADDITAAKAMLASPQMTVEGVAKRLGVGAATLYRAIPGGRQALIAL